MSYIYFAKPVGADGPIKIGHSGAVSIRIKQMEIDAQTKFEVIAQAPGDFTIERDLHRKFAADNVASPFLNSRGKPIPGATEWFAPSERLLAYITEVKATGEIALDGHERYEQSFTELYLSGETLQSIGDKFGITRERVRQVLRKAGVPSLGIRKKPPKDGTLVKAAAIAADYGAGLPASEIAKKYGMRPGSIYKFLRIAGVSPKRLPTCAQPISEKHVRAYEAGTSARQIAAELGLSDTVVRKKLGQQGVKLRSRADSMRMAHAQRLSRERENFAQGRAFRGLAA